MRKKILHILSVLSLSIATSAKATTIDFENYAINTQHISTGVYSQNGFNVTLNGSFDQITNSHPFLAGDGTNVLTVYNFSTETLTRQDSSLFDLISFWGGESWNMFPHSWARQIQVIGMYADLTTTTQIFNLDLIKGTGNGLQQFDLGQSFKNLKSVAFTGIGGNPEFSLDNIVVVDSTTVPEPSILALMGLGLAGMTQIRRRKTQA